MSFYVLNILPLVCQFVCLSICETFFGLLNFQTFFCLSIYKSFFLYQLFIFIFFCGFALLGQNFLGDYLFPNIFWDPRILGSTTYSTSGVNLGRANERP